MSDPADLERGFRQLAKRRLGADNLVSWERLSGGASQETYRLLTADGEGNETAYALRRAPGGVRSERSPGKPGLATEAKLFQVARDAGIPEPEVLWVLEPEDGLGVGFVMEWLEGETLGSRVVRSPDLADVRPRLARQCGEILGRIHGIDLEATGLEELLDPMTPSAFVDQTYGNYLALDTPQPMIDYTARWLREHLPRQHRMALVHNDFRNGNLMIGDEGVRAVLDWEIAHIGDPVRDLGWICVNSWRFGRSDLMVGGFGTLSDLLAGYESTSGLSVQREQVHFWIVFGSFWWAVGCLGMANHFRHGPDRSVERAAIGRRTTECQVDLVNLLIPGDVELVADPSDLDELAERQPADEMPRTDELLAAVNSYLREEVLQQTEGRTSFLARVSANALDVVRRDLLMGPVHRELETERLEALLRRTPRKLPLPDHRDADADATDHEPDADSLTALRWELVHALRDGAFSLDDQDLQAHLRNTVANQVAIDQPKYSGLRDLLDPTLRPPRRNPGAGSKD